MKTANQTFLEQFNEAFANSDSDFILNHTAENIRWTIIGENVIEGKEAFAKALKEMENDDPLELTIHHIITHGKAASVNGTMKVPGADSLIAFCDIYTFSGFKNPKISEMTSYAIEVKEH